MKTFEYKNIETGERVISTVHLTEEEMAEQGLKRVWSVAIYWPAANRGH